MINFERNFKQKKQNDKNLLFWTIMINLVPRYKFLCKSKENMYVKNPTKRIYGIKLIAKKNIFLSRYEFMHVDT